MAKKIFTGVSKQQEAYEETTVDVVDSNIESVFDVENGLNYFVGSGAVFTSNNGSSNSDSTTILTAKHDCTVSFDYSVSSEPSYDWLLVTLDDETLVNKISGVESGSCTVDMLAGGKLTFKYYKDGSQNYNDDCATFSNMKVVRREYTGGTENVFVIREVVQPFVNMSNVRRKVKKGFVNMSNVIRTFFESIFSTVFALNGSSSGVRTVHEYFRGKDASTGFWRFYLDSEGTYRDTTNTVSCVATVEGDFSNKTLRLTYKGTSTSSYTSSDDGLKLIYRQNGSWVTWDGITLYDLVSDTFTTKSTTFPSGTDAIRVGVWHATAGRHQSELIVSSLTVDGVELI